MAGVKACENLPKERYAIKDDTTITPLHQPGSVLDPLTEIAREGARQMLVAALGAEAASFVASFTDARLADGRQRVVHHGTGPERSIQTGIGAMPVQRHKVRDRATDVPAQKKIRFTSTILPRWVRRSRSLDALLPVLYLRGVSTGDFQDEAPSATGSSEGPNWRRCWGRTRRTCRRACSRASRRVGSRTTTAGSAATYPPAARSFARSLEPVAFAGSPGTDGVYLQARMGPTAEGMPVVIGATPEGRKELLGLQVGVRESARDAGASC